MPYLIAPSILAADFAKLGDEVDAVMNAGADVIHFDVMDSHYVPNLTIGPLVLESLRRRFPELPVDVHLMVKHETDQLVRDFVNAGASYISIHPDSAADPIQLLKYIRASHVNAGIVLNPDQPIATISPYLGYLDYILIMSVYPGKGGQSFIPESTDRLRQAKFILDTANSQIDLEVDGGIKSENIGEVAQAGANMFVAGTAIFGTPNYTDAIQGMRTRIESMN